jgi:hypothetical protein
MGIVKDRILDSQNRPVVIRDCAALVDAEVAAKSGVTGMVIRTGYKAFKAIKPTIVETAVDILLDDFAVKLDGQYQTWLRAHPKKDRPFDAWAKLRDAEIADDLLKVTDALMDRSNKNAIKKIYAGLRGIAKQHVASAVPAVARLVMKHVEPASATVQNG